MIEMDNDAYHADTTRVSKSGLDLIAKSPRHYWERYLNPKRAPQEQTRALFIGSAVHCAVLEFTEFENRYALSPKFDRRTKTGKADAEKWEADNANKTALNADDYDMIMRIRESVFAHPGAAVLLEKGVAERVLQWDDPWTGAPCKMKADWLSGTGFITDLKTTEDASPAAFGRSAFNYRYHVQGAFYSDGYKENFKKPAEGFAFIAVEKTAPYAVGVYYLATEQYELGQRTYQNDLEVYERCRAFNDWPAYGDEVMALQLPAYAFKSNFATT